jgi:hypothetical protein
MPESFAGITVPEGEPGGLRAAARQFNALAIEVDGAASRVQALPGQMASWSGPASARFAAAADDHAAAAGAGVSALTAAGQAAARYAEALDEAQDDARAAIEDARDATRRIRTLEQAIDEARGRQAAAQDRAASAAAAINTAGATGTPNPGAEADLIAAQGAAADAAADIVRLERRLEEARDDLRRAKVRGRRAEERAEQAGETAAAGFEALGDVVLYVGAPAAAAAAQVGSGHVPPMYPPRRPGGFAMSDAASGDGYRTHGDPLRFYRQWQAEEEARRAAEEAKEDDGGLFSDIVHGGLDVVGMVPVVGEPADLLNAGIYLAEGDHLNAGLSAGGAIPFLGMAATGAKWGKRAYDAADSLSDAARHAPGGYPTHSSPFAPLGAAEQQAAREWRDGLDSFPSRTDTDAGVYEVQQTGPVNLRMRSGETAIDADGFRTSDAVVLEAKHVGSNDGSPYVPDSSAPEFIKSKVRADTEREIERYAQIVRDSGNPARGLEVITNDPRAVPYFEELLSKYDLPARVVVRP